MPYFGKANQDYQDDHTYLKRDCISYSDCNVFVNFTVRFVCLYEEKSLFTTVQATAAVVDLSITTGLIYLLWRSREDAQYRRVTAPVDLDEPDVYPITSRMRTIIQKLLLLSLGTGVWTALFAIGTVITVCHLFCMRPHIQL